MWNKTLTLLPSQYYRCILWVILIAFPILTGMIVFDLHMLESRQLDSVDIPGPLAMIYDRYGYWPAVLILPALGALCGALMLHRIRALRTAPQVAK